MIIFSQCIAAETNCHIVQVQPLFPSTMSTIFSTLMDRNLFFAQSNRCVRLELWRGYKSHRSPSCAVQVQGEGNCSGTESESESSDMCFYRIVVICLLGSLVPSIAASKVCGPEKHCVPYEQCNEGLMVDGKFYPDRSRTTLDENCHYMEKCCNIPDKVSIEKVTIFIKFSGMRYQKLD